MNSRRSSSASSISSGTGQVMPITLARQTYSPTVVFPIASDCAIERSLIPSACLNRSTSRTLRIDNLSAGIRHPLRLLQGPDHAIRSPTDSPPSRHLSGGRLQLESCPPSVGISGRFTLEYAHPAVQREVEEELASVMASLRAACLY